MQKTFALVITLVLASACARSAWSAPLKVACTGTSAMQGLGSTTGHHVPDELGKALGAGFEVHNFGVQGTTAIQSIASSYAATSQMRAALALNPDVVLFWFGGNDSFQQNWAAHKGEFHADYLNLVRTFQALPSHPKTLLVRLWVFVDGPVQRTVVDKEILPMIDQIAVETGSVAIDYRKAFEMHPEYFPDGMHPNDTGTLAIGRLFADAVMGALAAQDAGTDGAPPDVARPSGDAAAADVTVVDADGAAIAADAGQSSVTAGSGGSISVAGAGGSTTGSAGAAAGGSGGASVGTSGGNATGGGGTVGNVDGGRSTTPGETPGTDATSGCSCRAASRTRAPQASSLFVVLVAAVWSWRRRRRELQGGCGSA